MPSTETHLKTDNTTGGTIDNGTVSGGLGYARTHYPTIDEVARGTVLLTASGAGASQTIGGYKTFDDVTEFNQRLTRGQVIIKTDLVVGKDVSG